MAGQQAAGQQLWEARAMQGAPMSVLIPPTCAAASSLTLSGTAARQPSLTTMYCCHVPEPPAASQGGGHGELVDSEAQTVGDAHACMQVHMREPHQIKAPNSTSTGASRRRRCTANGSSDSWHASPCTLSKGVRTKPEARHSNTG